ncbi:hypothetical protein PsYK624_050900 [Phanerochaete sordida]|uniref:Uncharacterized protein n=1 Tax=Phanerochaete sordida TaxID=48140 RepID=A0A9P3G668_9APHY|nr:hypothetical protein PsYK624_050900 [Phanerochaete sordida]
MQADYISTLRILIKYMVDETVAGLVASLFDPDILPSAALSGMKSLDIHHAVVQQNPPSDRTRISAHEGPRDMAFATPQREFRVEWSDITSPAIYSETLRQIASRLLALSTTDNIEELSLYSKVEAEEHPATILARLPSLKGMMVDGTLVPEVIEQLCSEDAATAARRWRQMNTLLVRYCTLMSGDLDALLAWCADHRESMRKLEFHGVDFEVASPNAMEAYVRGFGGIYQLEVCWGWGVCDVRCSDDGRAYRLRFEDQRYTMVDSDGDVVSDFYLASTCNDLA